MIRSPPSLVTSLEALETAIKSMAPSPSTASESTSASPTQPLSILKLAQNSLSSPHLEHSFSYTKTSAALYAAYFEPPVMIKPGMVFTSYLPPDTSETNSIKNSVMSVEKSMDGMQQSIKRFAVMLGSRAKKVERSVEKKLRR